MSCELEPYKQAFIARNNPGVLLFPDIRQLGALGKGGKAKMRRAMGCVAPDAWRPQPGEPWVEYRARGDLKG